MKITLFSFSLLIALLVLSCRETEQFTNSPTAVLTFSTDTVHFDTIFTSIGSTTHAFLFYNKNDEAVKTTISLGGGDNSFYRLNIDGEKTRELRDYEIMAHDSAYIFVEVNIDPQNSNNPMVITDSILFYTNGNQQNVKLQAFGQDVHLLNGDSIITNTTWVADKPYLIYNSLIIYPEVVLNIEAGVKIHFHNESAMYILGNIKVNGSAEEKVVFQGDRLEEDYQHLPSQWYGYIRNENGENAVGGLFFYVGSKGNVIDHAIIKNGAIGIQLYDTLPNNDLTLTLSNSIIKNMSAFGLLTQFSNTLVYNTTFANCGISAVFLSLGGHYEFYHSTIGNYYQYGRQDYPSLIFKNYYTSNKINTAFDFSAIFGNCIIYGNQENEFVADLDLTGNPEVSFLFDHCMMKLDKEFDTSNELFFKNITRHADSLPHFVDTEEGDYRLDSISAAKNKGTSIYSTIFPFDQDGIDRNADGKPDLGAYEWVGKEEETR